MSGVAFADAITDAAVQGLCVFYRTNENAVSFLNELLPGTDIPNLGRFARSRFCGDPGDVPIPQPPFTGGQCPGVLYRVLYDQVQPTVTLNRSVANNLGPVTSIEEGPDNRPGFTGFVALYVTDANGTRLIDSGPPGTTYTNIVLQRQDGQPDNCGNLPVPIPPYPTSGVTYVQNTSYVDVNNNTVNLSPSFTLFAPVLISPVTIIAPVRVDLPDFNFDGYFTLSPDFNFNFGRPSGIPNTPNKSTETGGPDCPDCDPTTSDDESDRKLIGMKVVSNPTGNTRSTVVAQSGAPTLYLPRTANAYFRVRNRAGLSWIGPIAVQTRNAFVPVPSNVNAVFGTVDFDTGWSGFTTQVYEGFEPEG